jgi:hypothetical protein
MKLLTKAIVRSLPPLGSTEGKAVARVKFFTPWANWTWYGAEYDERTGMFFGLIDGLEKEMGYFTLAELESVTGPVGLKVERDRHFKPVPLSDLGLHGTA